MLEHLLCPGTLLHGSALTLLPMSIQSVDFRTFSGMLDICCFAANVHGEKLGFSSVF